MPRVRYGQVHVFNNYYSAAGNNYAIGAGLESQLLIENNYFDGVANPHVIAAAGDTSQAIGTSSEAELSRAFEQIASAVASCDYTLDSAPPDPAELYVFFNDDPAPIARDGADGFSYEPAARRLQFHGGACEQVKSGAVSDIDVVYGCPQPVVD